MKIILNLTGIFFFIIQLSSCSTGSTVRNDFTKREFLDSKTFKLSKISTDKTYGYSEGNPIKTGDGPDGEEAFLNALLGPKGEPVSYQRTGSCCFFQSDNAPLNIGMLDIYEVKYEGLNNSVTLYLNMYDPGELKAPYGFTFKR
jgi:hypothetical protein